MGQLRMKLGHWHPSHDTTKHKPSRCTTRSNFRRARKAWAPVPAPAPAPPPPPVQVLARVSAPALLLVLVSALTSVLAWAPARALLLVLVSGLMLVWASDRKHRPGCPHSS